jgi:hypothetical protein
MIKGNIRGGYISGFLVYIIFIGFLYDILFYVPSLFPDRHRPQKKLFHVDKKQSR